MEKLVLFGVHIGKSLHFDRKLDDIFFGTRHIPLYNSSLGIGGLVLKWMKSSYFNVNVILTVALFRMCAQKHCMA